MKISRRLVLVVLLVIGVALGALVQAFNVIAGKNLDTVRQELQKVLGKDFNFNSLEVSLFSRPGFSAKGIRLADNPRFAATPILRAKELILGVSLWNLLRGRIVIDSLVFEEPELQVIIDEDGELNLNTLSARKKDLRSFPRFPSTAPERRAGAVSFAIGAVRVAGGRVEYLDRSVQAPAELQFKNIELAIRGFSPNEPTRIRLAAALTEGLNRDMRIDGEIAPPAPGAAWSQRQVNLALHFDSLHVPLIARAIAALRDRLPRALDVTRPMALQAKVSGTFERPRIDNFTLKVPLFGSSDYNAVATGAVDFSERRSWGAAQLQGELSVRSISFDRLRSLPFLQQLLSPAVITEGPVDLYSRFEGTWYRLRVGALLVADKADVRYRDLLRKPADTPALIKAQVTRQQDKYLFHESEMSVGTSKSRFSGSVETEPVPRLRLLLNGEQSSLAGWNQLLSPSEFLATRGRADWRIVVDKGLLRNDDRWSVYGDLKLSDAELRHKVSGRKFEKLSGQILFLGKQARLENGAFRLGSSVFSFNGDIPDLLQPAVTYELRSARMNLADLPALGAPSVFQLNDVSGKGQLRLANSRALLAGSFTAPQGSFRSTGFRDFRTDLLWSATDLAFSNFSLQIFQGTLRAEGEWRLAEDASRQLQFTWQADAIDTNPLIAQLIPPMKDRIEGRLSGRAKFAARAGGGAALGDALSGDGESTIQRGVIKNFNLVRQLLLRGGGTDSSAETAPRLPPGFAALLSKRDTPFDSIKASFVLEPRRIRTDDLVVNTADYTITGAGSLGFDRAMKWNGLLVLSQRLTQEIQREYRMLRYLLDRRGRLAISFRLEGTIPNVKIRLDNRILAQILRGDEPPRDGDADNASSEATKAGKKWLPDALERFLNR